MSDQRLEQLLEQSKQIYDLAVAGEWEQAEELDVERKKLIKACFTPQANFHDPEKAASKVREIIELDNKVVELSEKARGELRGALNAFRRGRQATEAYQQNR